MNDFDWDKCHAEAFRLPQDEHACLWMLCRKLGMGDYGLGRRILKIILAHVEHADTAHPWDDGMPAKLQYKIAQDEWEEFREQYFLARSFGLDDRDAPLCDEAKLREHVEHMLYEVGDLIAVLIKILRTL